MLESKVLKKLASDSHSQPNKDCDLHIFRQEINIFTLKCQGSDTDAHFNVSKPKFLIPEISAVTCIMLDPTRRLEQQVSIRKTWDSKMYPDSSQNLHSEPIRAKNLPSRLCTAVERDSKDAIPGELQKE